MAEGVLSHSPNDLNGLYQSALINFHLNNADAARGRLERLVKLSGSYFAAWELMVQVTQAQGDLAARDQAISRLKVAISTAIDPEIRRLSDFIRDRIPVGDKEILVADYFSRGGGDFTRYQFALGDPHWKPDTGSRPPVSATWAVKSKEPAPEGVPLRLPSGATHIRMRHPRDCCRLQGPVSRARGRHGACPDR